jgi:hypothetical protein
MKIEINNADFNDIIQYLTKNPQQLFLIDYVRHKVANARYQAAKAGDGVKITEDQQSLWENALNHNLSGLEDFGSTQRTNRLIRPLYAIDKVFFQAHKLKVLCVGPRTEMELLSLVGQGFQPSNIRGLDLFSYSP